MQYRSLLYAQLFFVALIAAIHLLGLEYYLYWRFLWLDLVSHTLGGIWLGLLVFSVRTFFRYPPNLVWSVVGAIVIGIGWEIFEVVAGIPREANWTFDTSLDILMDALGGVIGGYLANFLSKRRNNSKAMV